MKILAILLLAALLFLTYCQSNSGINYENVRVWNYSTPQQQNIQINQSDSGVKQNISINQDIHETPQNTPTSTPPKKSITIDCKQKIEIPRGECLETLGDYPYPFLEGVVIVYSAPSDLDEVEKIAAIFGTCSKLVKDTDLDLANNQYHIISVGSPCVNKITAQLLGVSYPFCNLKEEAIIELKDIANKKALLVYGSNTDETLRAVIVLRDYNRIREKLKSANKSCPREVKVKGTSLTISRVITTQ